MKKFLRSILLLPLLAAGQFQIGDARGGAAAGPTNIQGQWLIDEGTGNHAFDSSGFGNTATFSGGNSGCPSSFYATGGLGGGLPFSGCFFIANSTKLQASVAGNLNITSAPILVSAWIYFFSSRADSAIISNLDVGATAGYELRVDGTGNIAQFFFGNGTAFVGPDVSNTSLSINTVYHVCATYDGVSSGSLWINGVQQTMTITTGGPIASSSQPVTIGARPPNTNFTDALINDVRVYSPVGKTCSQLFSGGVGGPL